MPGDIRPCPVEVSGQIIISPTQPTGAVQLTGKFSIDETQIIYGNLNIKTFRRLTLKKQTRLSAAQINVDFMQITVLPIQGQVT